MTALRATFVRARGERDRIYVTRSDGTEVSWVFPTYGDGLPHDLVHLVVESVFGLSRGFWGRVDAGADPGRISDEANRMGGKDKYAAFGADQRELQLAEALAAAAWMDEDGLARLVAACETAGHPLRLDPDDPRVEAVRHHLGDLGARWSGLVPKGSLTVEFDAAEPQRSLTARV